MILRPALGRILPHLKVLHNMFIHIMYDMYECTFFLENLKCLIQHFENQILFNMVINLYY